MATYVDDDDDDDDHDDKEKDDVVFTSPIFLGCQLWAPPALDSQRKIDLPAAATWIKRHRRNDH